MEYPTERTMEDYDVNVLEDGYGTILGDNP